MTGRLAEMPRGATMAVSVFDLFKIGIGPSSSHTVGPMKAVLMFLHGLKDEGRLEQITSLKAELFGSLAATGKGHGSDKAVMLGIEGETPEAVDTAKVEARIKQIRDTKTIRLLGERDIEFIESEHLIMNKRASLPYHPNGMRFTAFGEGGLALRTRLYYSVGGGFVLDEQAVGDSKIVPDKTPLPYEFRTSAQLLEHCRAQQMSISQVMLENEKVWRSEEDIRAGLLKSGTSCKPVSSPAVVQRAFCRAV